MDAWELGAVISLTNIRALRVRASIADVGDLGVGAFITDFWRKGVCRIRFVLGTAPSQV